MNRSLREVVTKSHVAAATIAVLIFFSFNAVFDAIWPPILQGIEFVLTAIAILDVPYFSTELSTSDKLVAFHIAVDFCSAFIAFSAAWVLAKWAYGVGPFRCLSEYRKRLLGGIDA